MMADWNPPIPDAAQPAKSTRRAALEAGAGIGIVALAVSAAATQYTAWRLHYHAALGKPLFGSVYAPWDWIPWQFADWPAAATTMSQVRGGVVVAAGACLFATLHDLRRRARMPRRHEGVHGTARFARIEDAREAGLLPPKPGRPWDGLYVGAWEDDGGGLQYMRHSGPEHILALGPLRSGKTHGIAVPNLLSWGPSAVVYDPKGELYSLSAGWRREAAGNRVLRWEPAAVGGTISVNLLSEVRLGTPQEYGDVAAIVEAIGDPSGEGFDGEAHWVPAATSLLIGVALFVMHEQAALGRAACFADVLAALQDPDRPADELYLAMAYNGFGAAGGRHPKIAAAAQAQINRDPREGTSVHSTATRLLRLFDDPVVAENTRRSDVRLRDLMDGEEPVSLYIVPREEHSLRLRPLVTLFLNMMMGRLCSADISSKEGDIPHRHPMLLMIDEFASLGRMEALVSALSRCAGYGIRALLLAQDYQQILSNYGEHETVTGACHIQVVYTPNNLATAEWISRLLDRTTVITEDATESGQLTGEREGKGYSRAFHGVARDLLTPGEVMRLRAPAKDRKGKIVAPGQILVRVAGRYTILGVQSLYFLDPAFRARAAIAAPPMDRPTGRSGPCSPPVALLRLTGGAGPIAPTSPASPPRAA